MNNSLDAGVDCETVSTVCVEVKVVFLCNRYKWPPCLTHQFGNKCTVRLNPLLLRLGLWFGCWAFPEEVHVLKARSGPQCYWEVVEFLSRRKDPWGGPCVSDACSPMERLLWRMLASWGCLSTGPGWWGCAVLGYSLPHWDRINVSLFVSWRSVGFCHNDKS